MKIEEEGEVVEWRTMRQALLPEQLRRREMLSSRRLWWSVAWCVMSRVEGGLLAGTSERLPKKWTDLVL